jgi:phenylacetate-CoA ligase
MAESKDLFYVHWLKAFRDLMPQQMEHTTWKRAQVLAHQETAFRDFLAHVKAHCPFYAPYFEGWDITKATAEDIKRFPVLTKSIVLDHWNDIVSNSALKKEAAEAHLKSLVDGTREDPYWHDTYRVYATGGSSGVRGLYVWEDTCMAMMSAVTFRYQSLEEDGVEFNQKKLTAAIIAPGEIHASVVFLPPYDPEMEVVHVPADLSHDALIARLNELQPSHIIGYTSLIVYAAQAQIDGALSISPRRISTNSEPLSLEDRQKIKKAFGVETHNMWGSVEVGVIGVEDSSHRGMYLAEDYCIIEPVDADMRPANNDTSKKLLVTNFFRYDIPLIRYVLDDAVIIEEDFEATGYRWVTEIKGRADDWFVYGDINIHPMVYRGVLGQFTGITEYQVRQTEQGADVIAVLNKACELEKIQHMLVEALGKSGLTDPVVTVTAVDDIARHPETGKVTRFKSL